jgi:hypothetical protein
VRIDRTSVTLGRWVAAAGLLAASGFVRAGYEEGRDAYQRGDFPRALAEFVPAASTDARAALALSGMFERGEGVPRDPYQALMWLRQAGEIGDAATQYQVGQAYARGAGAPADPREARQWYRRAAERGHADAAYALGRLYADGNGMAPDPTEGRRWIELAAQAGHPQARAWLGLAPAPPPAAATPAPPVPDTPHQAQTPPAAGDRYADVEPTRPRRPQTTWYYGFSYGYGWGPYWGWYDPFWGPPWPYAGWGWGYPRYGCCPGGGVQFGVIIRP